MGNQYFEPDSISACSGPRRPAQKVNRERSDHLFPVTALSPSLDQTAEPPAASQKQPADTFTRKKEREEERNESLPVFASSATACRKPASNCTQISVVNRHRLSFTDSDEANNETGSCIADRVGTVTQQVNY